MKAIAVDSGYSYMKATDGDKKILFSNISVPGYEKLIHDANLNTSVEDSLDVLIDDGITEKRYFVGEMAVTESRQARYIWEKDRLNSEYAKATFLTALALLCDDGDELIVSTGLPYVDYSSNKKAYDNFVGKYSITFMSGPLKGTKKTLYINSVRTYVQGMGIFYDQVFDYDGDADMSHPLLGNGAYGLIDVGMRTTNLELFENRRLVEGYSKGIELGMSYVHEQIQKELTKKSIGHTDGQIEDIIRGKNSYAVATYGLQPVIDEALNYMAKEIYRAASPLWNDKALTFRGVYVGGGGGAAIFNHLKFENKMLVQDPQFSNVNGFYKALIRAIRLGKVAGNEQE